MISARGSVLAACVAAVCAAGAPGCTEGEPLPAFDAGQAVIEARAALRQAVAAKDPTTRIHALEALAQVSGPRAGGVFLQALADENPSVRIAAAMAVGDSACAAAKARLVAMAGDKHLEPDRRVLCATIYALHRLGVEQYHAQLADLLTDGEAEVRALAAMAMGRIGDPSAIEPLKIILDDEQDPAVKLQIHESLALLGEARSRVLLEGYTKGYFLDLRLAAIPALVRSRSPRARPVLQGLLRRARSPRVRVAAARGLAEMGVVEDAGYAACLRAVRHPRDVLNEAYAGQRKVTDLEAASLQQLAALALGPMKRPAAVGVLLPLLSSSDGSIRVAAAMAILKLLDADGATPATRPAAAVP